MLDDIWTSILELTSKLVMPDWGGLVALIPIGLLVVVVIWLILLVRRFATAGPTRRGKRRMTPVAPAHIHMPGGSIAPALVALGATVLFWGLVVGGTALWIGIGVLVLTLLVWGAEGLRDYDQLGDAAVARLPAPQHAGPPPGIHMPGPSFRPVLAALGATVLFFGLVFGGWLLLVGIIILVVTLLGWLFDARKEYAKTVEADRTGHLENIDEPRWPGRTLWVGALLVVLALLADNGVFPPRSDQGAGGPGGSPPPTTGGGGSPAPGSQAPGASGPAADVTIVAQGIDFTTKEATAAGPDFTIAFDNRDGAPHDVDILGGGTKLFDGEVFTGPKVEIYEVTGVPAGQYEFICSIHSNMKGTITVQ